MFRRKHILLRLTPRRLAVFTGHAVTSVSGQVGPVSSHQVGRTSAYSLAEKMSDSRRIHQSIAQQRHLQARLRAVLDNFEVPGRHPGSPASSSGKPSVDIESDGRDGWSAHVRIHLFERCIVRLPVATGKTRGEAEERAIVSALSLFPSNQAWRHFSEATDSHVFRQLMSLASMSDIDSVELYIAEDPGEAGKSSPLKRQSRHPHDGTGGIANRYIVTVAALFLPQSLGDASDNRPATSSLWSRVDTSCSRVALARENALTARDALKLALVSAVPRMDELADRECGDALRELKIMLVEKRAAERNPLLSSKGALQGYISVHSRHVKSSSATHLPPLETPARHLPSITNHYPFRVRRTGETLVLVRDRGSPLKSYITAAKASAYVRLVGRDLSVSVTPHSVEECLQWLMASPIASLPKSVSSTDYSGSISMVDLFKDELAQLYRGEDDESRSQRSGRSIRLISAALPYIARRVPNSLDLSLQEPLTLLQEAFLTLAFLATVAVSAREEWSGGVQNGGCPEFPSSPQLTPSERAVAKVTGALSTAAAWSLCGDTTSTWASVTGGGDTSVWQLGLRVQQSFAPGARIVFSSLRPDDRSGTRDAVLVLPTGSLSETFLSSLQSTGRVLFAAAAADESGFTTTRQRGLQRPILLLQLPRRASPTRSAFTVEERYRLFHRAALPAAAHPMMLYVSDPATRVANLPSSSALMAPVEEMLSRGRDARSALVKRESEQDELYVPDVQVMLHMVREALGLPASSLPSIKFFQEARHDPALRVRQLRDGHPGDVDFMTRVVVKWADPTGRRPYVFVAESDPQNHRCDVDGLPVFDFGTDARTALFSLRDTGEPRGPLTLLIAAICSLYDAVVGHVDGRPLPLINVRVNPDWSTADGSSRRAMDFLLYSWFGAAPQVRCYEIETHERYVVPAPTFGHPDEWRGEVVAQQGIGGHMIRAMLLYDILGQRVLFAETHDTTVAAATKRMDTLAVQLNMPRVHFPHGASSGGFRHAEGPVPAAGLRSHRSIAAEMATLTTAARLERLMKSILAPHVSPEVGTSEKGGTAYSPVTDATRLLRVFPSELAALSALIDAILNRTAVTRPRSDVAHSGHVIVCFTGDGDLEACVKNTVLGHRVHEGDAWWGHCVAGLAVPAIRGVAEVRVVDADDTSGRGAPGQPRTQFSLRGVVGDATDGLLPVLTRLSRQVVQHLLTVGGVAESTIDELLVSCRRAAPLLERAGDGFPLFHGQFYYPPRLLGVLLQGLTGRYECSYDRCVLGSEKTHRDVAGKNGGDRGAGRPQPETNAEAVYYTSPSFNPKSKWRHATTQPGAGEAGRPGSPAGETAVRCVLWVSSIAGHGNGTSPSASTTSGRFPLGIGLGRTKREAWLSAAWHALHHNFPDVVEQLEMFKRVCELRRCPQSMLSLAVPPGRASEEGLNEQQLLELLQRGPRALVWRWGKRRVELTSSSPGTDAGDFWCGSYLLAPASPRRSPWPAGGHSAAVEQRRMLLLTEGMGPTPASAYAQAAQSLLTAAAAKRSPPGGEPDARTVSFANWNATANFSKSIWHALRGGIAARYRFGEVQIHFNAATSRPHHARGRRAGEGNFLPQQHAGVEMVISARTWQEAGKSWAASSLRKVGWHDLLLLGIGVEAGRQPPTTTDDRSIAMLSSDISQTGTAFLIGCVRALQSVFVEQPAKGGGSVVTAELQFLLTSIVRDLVTPATRGGPAPRRQHRRDGSGGASKITPLDLCVRGVQAVTGLQAQCAARKRANTAAAFRDGDDWVAELVMYLPTLPPAFDTHAADAPARKRMNDASRLPMTVFATSGRSRAEAEARLTERLQRFLRVVARAVRS